jgi:hypothetical protein
MGTLGYKRVTGGGDLGKQLEGTKPNSVRADNDEQRERAPYVSMRELLQQLQRQLIAKGWKLQPTLGGDFAGFNVYVSQSPNSALMLNAPGFKHWVRVKPDDARIEGFLERVLAIANSARMESDDKTLAAQWTAIAKSFIDRPKDGRSEVAMAAMGLSDGQLQRSLKGAKDCYKFVPPVEWFPENVQQIDVPKLFETLMPEAEAEALMLMLGKTLLGNPGNPTSEGVVPDTKFAALSVLIGFEGGEGKSSLMSGYLGTAMELLGYDVATIDPESNRFSNLWVVSDYAYCDELDDAAHQRLLTQWALLKSVVSGQKRVLVEAKGVQSWEVNPTAQPFFSSNNYSDTWLQKSNGGMRRRYFPLQCYGAEESSVIFGDNWKRGRIAELWQREAAKLGVTVQCLSARVLRYCLDLYLDVCGIVITDSQIMFNWETSRLENRMQELRAKFRINVDMEHGKRLVDAIEAVSMAAIKTIESRYQPMVMERLHKLTLMPKALHTVIDIWRMEEALPESLKAMYLEDISPNVRQTWDSQTDRLHQDILSSVNPSKVWERLIECLTVKGKEWHFQKSIASYSVRWNTKLMTLRHKLEALPQCDVDTLPETTYGYLKELGQQILVVLNIVNPPRRGR